MSDIITVYFTPLISTYPIMSCSSLFASFTLSPHIKLAINSVLKNDSYYPKRPSTGDVVGALIQVDLARPDLGPRSTLLGQSIAFSPRSGPSWQAEIQLLSHTASAHDSEPCI